MKNSNKKKLDGNSFLLVVTIVLFFAMYIVGIIMFGDRGFAKVQNFLNLFISNAGLIEMCIRDRWKMPSTMALRTSGAGAISGSGDMPGTTWLSSRSGTTGPE